MKNFKNMSGFIALAFVSVSMWVSCDVDYGELKNNSQYTVYFKLKSDLNYSPLNPGKSYELSADEDIYAIKYYGVPPRVSLRVIDSDNGEFFDTPKIDLEVLNTTGYNVNLSSGGCMDTEPLLCSKDPLNTTNGEIFSATPDFTAVTVNIETDTPTDTTPDGFPMTASYIYDPVANKIKVTIRP